MRRGTEWGGYWSRDFVWGRKCIEERVIGSQKLGLELSLRYETCFPIERSMWYHGCSRLISLSMNFQSKVHLWMRQKVHFWTLNWNWGLGFLREAHNGLSKQTNHSYYRDWKGWSVSYCAMIGSDYDVLIYRCANAFSFFVFPEFIRPCFGWFYVSFLTMLWGNR